MIPRNFMSAARIGIPSALHGLYVASVFFAVLTFGAVRPYPITLSTMVASLVALLCLLVFGGPSRARWLFLTFLLLGCLTFLWVWLQSLQSVLPSSMDNALWGDLVRASISPNGAISIVPADSIMSLLDIAVPLLSFLTGLIITRSDEDARKLINMLTIGGAIFAIYGLVQLSFFPETNLFFPKTAYGGDLTTTFVNKNTAGTFLGLAALAALRYAWSLGKQIALPKVIRRLMLNRKVETAGLLSFLFVGLSFVFVILALFMTNSRGATASSVVALALMLGFLFLQRNTSGRSPGFFAVRRGRKAFIRIAAALVLVVVIFATFGGRTILRTEIQGADDGRYCVLPGIVELAKGEPLLGYGFGTFRYAFTPYRAPECGLLYVWDRAHNVYLEGFIGLGVLFPVVLVIGVGALLIAHFIGIRERRRMKTYSVMGLAGILLLGLHSLVDFSIEIPGLAAYAAALLAATSSISLGKSGGQGLRQERKSSRSSS